MEKNRWLDFISTRFRSQIALENAAKAQTWALALTALAAFGWAILELATINRRSYLYSSKILFVTLFHLLLFAGIWLPTLLRRGENWLSRFLGIRDFTSLVLVLLLVGVYAAVVTAISFQVAAGVEEIRGSNFLRFLAWAHFGVSVFYLASLGLAFLSLFLFPGILQKAVESGMRSRYGLFGTHAAFVFLLALGYSETVAIGSPVFFTQLRLTGLFWIAIATSVVWLGRLLSQSCLPPLAALEMEVASGRLERRDDILIRLKDAFVLERLAGWLGRISHRLATQAHEIARYAHESVTLVSTPKPTEFDLRQVEDRYRRADHLYKRLDRENQKFLLTVSFFDLNEAEREKIEELRDQFSRELRSAKLELASVRKRIDEKLVSIKHHEKAATTPEVPVEKVPIPH